MDKRRRPARGFGAFDDDDDGDAETPRSPFQMAEGEEEAEGEVRESCRSRNHRPCSEGNQYSLHLYVRSNETFISHVHRSIRRGSNQGRRRPSEKK